MLITATSKRQLTGLLNFCSSELLYFYFNV